AVVAVVGVRIAIESDARPEEPSVEPEAVVEAMETMGTMHHHAMAARRRGFGRCHASADRQRCRQRDRKFSKHCSLLSDVAPNLLRRPPVAGECSGQQRELVLNELWGDIN